MLLSMVTFPGWLLLTKSMLSLAPKLRFGWFNLKSDLGDSIPLEKWFKTLQLSHTEFFLFYFTSTSNMNFLILSNHNFYFWTPILQILLSFRRGFRDLQLSIRFHLVIHIVAPINTTFRSYIDSIYQYWPCHSYQSSTCLICLHPSHLHIIHLICT